MLEYFCIWVLCTLVGTAIVALGEISTDSFLGDMTISGGLSGIILIIHACVN